MRFERHMEKNLMKSQHIPLLCSVLAFAIIFFVGQSYLGILVENTRQSDTLALAHKVEQQVNTIHNALLKAETPLFTLSDMLTVRQGEFTDFETYAKHLLSQNPLVSGLFLIPDGVVRVAYPLEGNEAAIGHDLLQDPARKVEVQEAIDTNQIIMAGPVNMRQGGVGLIARKPVFWEENGRRRFWGLVAALIRWESILPAFEFDALNADGYAYALSRKLSTETTATLMTGSPEAVITHLALTKSLSIPGGEWLLAVSAKQDHLKGVHLSGNVLLTLLGLFIAGLVFHLVRGRAQIFMQADILERMNGELAQDIARREQIEEELHLAKDAAVAATKAKSDFLATMSHEIRTPMNGVHGMLQLLETTALNAEQQDYVQTGSTALRNLLSLINDILDFSKIEAGKLDIMAVPFAVSELCRSIPSIFKEQTITKGLTLDIEMAADIPEMVVADPSRIRQVLLNVVGNAVKFTDQGGVKVRISSDTASVPFGSVRLDFKVSDTGIGIPPDHLPDLFQPFSQGRSSLIRTHPGTGLGLSIVKRLVELMHGEVDLQSTLGTGTTVRFHVMAKLHEKIRPGGGSDALEAPKNRTMPEAGIDLAILVAEDDETSRAMMSRLLEKMGCTVMHAADGQEAVLLFTREDVDLILMDIQMPVMDGVEATRRIRTDPSLGEKSRVPIIAVTAFAMSGDRERFLAAGMDDYVAKPVNVADLKAALDRVGQRMVVMT